MMVSIGIVMANATLMGSSKNIFKVGMQSLIAWSVTELIGLLKENKVNHKKNMKCYNNYLLWS